MSRWYPLEPADASFLDTAAHRYVNVIDAPVAPEAVWASLQSDRSLAAWGRSVKSVEWTSARPFTVGTTRQVTLPLGATVREEFFRWEDGERYSFFVRESSLPGLRRFAEDYVVTAHDGGARLTWTVAIEARPRFAVPVRLLSPVVGLAFAQAAREGRAYFARQAGERTAS